MKKEKYSKRIKQVLKERDGSFYLMIFVVFFTFLTIFLWASNLKAFVVNDKKEGQFFIQIDEEKKEDLNKSIDNLMLIFDSLDEKNELTENELNANSTSSDDSLKEENKSELEEIKQRLNKKISELNTSSFSSVPILSQELDDSEQEINKLRLKIAELEEKLSEK